MKCTHVYFKVVNFVMKFCNCIMFFWKICHPGEAKSLVCPTPDISFSDSETATGNDRKRREIFPKGRNNVTVKKQSGQMRIS